MSSHSHPLVVRPSRFIVNGVSHPNVFRIPKTPRRRTMSPPPPYGPPPPSLQAGELTSRGNQMAQTTTTQASADPRSADGPRDAAGNLITSAFSHPVPVVYPAPLAVDIDYANDDEDEEDDEESGERLSQVTFHVNTTVSICSENNLVCLADSPSAQGAAVAKAVVDAVRHGSSGQCGIPMIDESGRPRPLRINVDAGLHVKGSGNVVGNETIINQFLRHRAVASSNAAAASASASAATATASAPSPPASTRGTETAGVRRQRDESDDDEDVASAAAPKRRRSE